MQTKWASELLSLVVWLGLGSGGWGGGGFRWPWQEMETRWVSRPQSRVAGQHCVAGMGWTRLSECGTPLLLSALLGKVVAVSSR